MHRLLLLLLLFSCTPSDRCEPGTEACREGKASLCAPNQAWVVVVDCPALGPGWTCGAQDGVTTCIEVTP